MAIGKHLLLFSLWVVSNSLWPHRLPHQAPLSSTVFGSLLKFMSIELVILSISALFFFCLQSFLASGSFPISRLFASGGQSIRALASSSVLSMNTQCWFLSGLTGLIFFQSKGLSRVFSNTTVQKHQFLRCSGFFMIQFTHPYMTTGKTVALGWPKSLFWFFCKMAWKNLNKHFDQPSI